MPGDFARAADFSLPVERLKQGDPRGGRRRASAHFFDATRTAAALFGNSLGANMFMLGFAFQHGGLPLSARGGREGDRAQRRGGGDERRRLPLGPPRRPRAGLRARRSIGQAQASAGARPIAQTLDEIIARRVEFLTAYQRRRLCAPLSASASRAIRAGRSQGRAGLDRRDRGGRAQPVQADGGQGRIRGGAALHRRLASQRQLDGSSRAIEQARIPSRAADPRPQARADGKPRKSSFGPWMMKGFRLLAALKGLRGTPFDLFGYSAERRMERRLLAEYEARPRPDRSARWRRARSRRLPRSPRCRR